MLKRHFFIKTILVFVMVGLMAAAMPLNALTNDRATSDANSILWGDVNASGEVTIVDALLVAQYCVGLLKTLTNPQAADVSADNAITILDALLIAQYSVGLINQFPAQIPTDPRLVSLGEPFRILYGETVMVNNERLILSFETVADSRCPTGVVCVWAGEAVLGLRIEVLGKVNPELYTLKNPPNDPSAVIVAPYLITCLAVDPYPVYGEPLLPQDYIATLIVTKQAPPTPPPTSSPQPGPRTVPFNEPFRIQYGETVRIDKIATEISFVQIKDSRCPREVQCVWAGEVTLGLEIQEGSIRPLLYNFTNPPTSINTGYRKYTCLAVEPYPVTVLPIPVEDYIATFIVQDRDLP